MTITIEKGAKQRPSGCWIPYTIINGKTTYYDHLIKKTQRSALGAIKHIKTN